MRFAALDALDAPGGRTAKLIGSWRGTSGDNGRNWLSRRTSRR